VSGSGISWAISKSASRSRQVTTPAPHHLVFYRADALPATQPTASKHWRHLLTQVSINKWEKPMAHCQQNSAYTGCRQKLTVLLKNQQTLIERLLSTEKILPSIYQNQSTDCKEVSSLVDQWLVSNLLRFALKVPVSALPWYLMVVIIVISVLLLTAMHSNPWISKKWNLESGITLNI